MIPHDGVRPAQGRGHADRPGRRKSGAMGKRVKIGVFGARRGLNMLDMLSRHPDAELAAVCDADRRALREAQAVAGRAGLRIRTYTDFGAFLDDEMDAVVLANYATEHAPYAVRVLDSGRHACSEVLACQNLAEAVALVEAVERSRKVYTYAENYCYFRGTLEMQRLYRRGDIGEFLHGEGEYVHDCEGIWPAITRGERSHWRNWIPATFYCTHSIGPILTITGTRPTRVTAYETPNRVKRRFGGRGADGAVIVCQMSNGATAKFLPWCNFPRRPEAVWYAVYGTRGMMETDRWGDTFNRLNVYIEGDPEAAAQRSYDPRPCLQTPLSRAVSGHGGSDFYTLHFFLEAVLGRAGKRHAIDVHRALDMTLPGILAFRSIMQGNAPVDVPDLRRRAERDKYREDRWSPDPKLAGPGQPGSSCSWEDVKVPDAVYRRVAARYRQSLKPARRRG
jgi:predicted dehydrogenase